jgi:hypothetical protein
MSLLPSKSMVYGQFFTQGKMKYTMKKMSTIIRYLALIMMPFFIVSCGGSSSSDESALDILSSDASLSELTFVNADLDQVFQSTQPSYTASVGYVTTSLTLRFVASNSAASIKVNDDSVASGSDTAQIPLDEGDNTVTVEVTAEDGQTTQTYTLEVSRASATEFTQQAYLKAINAEGGDYFGNSVALDGDTLVVGVPSEDSGFDDVESDNSATGSGAVYVFTRVDGSWRQQAYLKASNVQTYDYFGYTVAVDGDTLVVGAILEDSNANDGETDNSAAQAGAVYVFTRVDSSWSQQALLKASNAEGNDYFGYTVAVDGDTVVVGAFREDSSVDGGEMDNSAEFAGAVYVFTRVDSNWSQQAYLKASNAEDGDNFGWRVALDGDTLVVGVRDEDSSADGGETDNSADGAGAVYVFTRVDSIWSQQALLKASNAEGGDNFGYSVALDGDTVVVGVPKEASSADGGETDNSADGAGAVYVFTRVGSEWSQQTLLKASNAEGGDQFGSSVALDGDTLVVGATKEASSVDGGETDNSATEAGAVYVFTRVDSIWSQQAFLKASNAEGGDQFGSSVALDGDTLVVGAIKEASSVDGGESDNSAADAGAVYVFQ